MKKFFPILAVIFIFSLFVTKNCLAEKIIMTVDIPKNIPIADSNGEIPGSKNFSNVDRKIVTFGKYFQDNSDKLFPIEWIVLEEKEGYSLLLTKKIVASMGWVNVGKNNVTWAESDLRKWLNKNFYETAFSREEKNNMALFNAVQLKNPRYDTPEGESTIDNVSILSYQELVKLMPTDLERKTQPTDYAIKQGCYLNPEGDSAWWLRSPGPAANIPEHLASWGNLGARTHYVDDVMIGVRPVIWVKSNFLNKNM